MAVIIGRDAPTKQSYFQSLVNKTPTTNVMQAPTTGSIATKAPTPTPLQQAVTNLATAQTGINTGGGGGIASQTSTIPTQTFPTFNLSVPNLAWNPNAQQKTDWLSEAVKRANLQIDPQVLSANQGYERFNTLAENQVAEINPQYDALSNAIANVFKNTVNQNLVNSAIRRGATESGWLPEELAKAGREEVSQRRNILSERDQILDSIRNQVLAKRQETDDTLAALETMRGAQTDVNYADLERLARGDFLEEKQNTFNNQLSNAQFQSGYSMDQANYLLNQFATQKNAALAEAELALNERKTALDEAMANYQMAQANAKTYQPAAKTYTVRIGNYDVPLTTAQYISYMSDLNNKSGNKSLAEYLFGE
jgi:hypothetical protein